MYFDLIDRYQENKAAGGSRKDFLEMAAEIPGIYVPSFYDPEYNEDGTLKSFTPNNSHAKEKIRKQVVADMDSVGYIEKPLVPYIKVHSGPRGSGDSERLHPGCRFCQPETYTVP